MTQMQYSYLDSLTQSDSPQNEEDLINQAYSRFLFLLDQEPFEELPDLEEHLKGA